MPYTIDRPRLFVFAALAGLVGWAYLPTLSWMFDKWVDDPQYSHGFLVPLFSGWLLWRKGPEALLGGVPRPGFAALFVALSLGMRWLAGKLLFHQLDTAAMLFTLFGLTLAFGGWKLARAAGPSIAYLVFMVPLPYELEQNVGGPLKIAATQASTFLLQTMGYPAIAEGNVILIDDVRLGVVDACSGLKMLVTFSAFAAGAVLVLERGIIDKIMILLGIVPIAVAVNVLRVTATGVAYTLTTDKATRDFLHDLYGWLMMPGGLGLLALQLWALNRLLIYPEPAIQEYVSLRPVAAAPTPAMA